MKKLKLLLVFLISLFMCLNTTYAIDTDLEEEIKTSEEEVLEKYIKGERTESNNYGVEKKWKITDSNKTNVLDTPYVDETIKIYDFSDVLTDEEEQELKTKAMEFTEKYKTDLIIVTYYLPYSSDSTNETFASDFYDYNSFGIDYKLYDGIVLFRNTYDADPYYDMYTFGNAQLYFDQTRYDNILDGIYFDLHMENYLDGFTDFIDYVNNYYESGIPTSRKNYTVDDNGYLYKKYSAPILLGIVISAVVTAIVLVILINKNKMVRKATKASSYLDKNSITYTKLVDRFLGSHVTHHTISTSSGGSGGGGSHGGSSGGGHSSGGGRHG